MGLFSDVVCIFCAVCRKSGSRAFCLLCSDLQYCSQATYGGGDENKWLGPAKLRHLSAAVRALKKRFQSIAILRTAILCGQNRVA